MKIEYKGKDEMYFVLAFSFFENRKGFFIELFTHRWDFNL